MNARTLEEAIALARLHANVDGVAVAVDRDRHVNAGLSLRPNAAEEACQIANLLAGDGEPDSSHADIGLFGRSFVSQTDDDKPVLDLGRVQPEPWPRLGVAPAEFQEIVED